MRTDLDQRARQRQWLAVYTAPRHEKQVFRQLGQRSLECFLPVYETVRNWKTGSVSVSLPLFPGYLFAHVDDAERRRLMELPSVVKIVGNRFGPTSIPDGEIDVLRQAVKTGVAQPHPYLSVGTRVRVVNGVLSGLQGVLLRHKASCKVIVNVELMMQSIAVEVNSYDLEFCHATPLAA